MNKRAILKATIFAILTLITFSPMFLPDEVFYVNYHENQPTFICSLFSFYLGMILFFGTFSLSELITNFFIEKQEE